MGPPGVVFSEVLRGDAGRAGDAGQPAAESVQLCGWNSIVAVASTTLTTLVKSRRRRDVFKYIQTTTGRRQCAHNTASYDSDNSECDLAT